MFDKRDYYSYRQALMMSEVIQSLCARKRRLLPSILVISFPTLFSMHVMLFHRPWFLEAGYIIKASDSA